MKEYFLLQVKLIFRRIQSIGINPILGVILIVGLTIVSAPLLFNRTDFAGYIYFALTILALFPLSKIKRNDFLKFHFGSGYRKIRFLENFLVSIPSMIILLVYQSPEIALATLLTSGILTFIKSGKEFNVIIPSPFSKRLFEFTVGFRKSFVLIGISYVIALIGISVPNFNLGIFSVILIFIVSFYSYAEPENEYFVWIYKLNPKQFILHKIKTAIINSSLLILPLILPFAYFFQSEIFVLLIFICAGYFSLATVIVAKYSAYPDKMNIPQGILLFLCIQLPPLILIVFPYFYSQAVKKLNPLLK